MDRYDVAAEIDAVFKDISIQFDYEDYEELLNEAKQNLSSEMFVPTKEFEQLLCEWIMAFKEEVSSGLLSESLDIVQIKYIDSLQDIENAFKITSGRDLPEIDVDKIPVLMSHLMPIFGVRIVDLTKKTPKSEENVCTDKQEQEFYNELIKKSQSLSHQTVSLKAFEQILIEYFKSIDTKYSFVQVKNYDSEQGIDPFNDLGEDNPFTSKHKKLEHEEDEAHIREVEENIRLAEQEGNLEKVELMK